MMQFAFLNRMTVSTFMVYFNSLFNFTLIHCSVIIADSLLSDGNHVTVQLGWTRRPDGECWWRLSGGVHFRTSNSLWWLEMYRVCPDPFCSLRERSLVRHSSLLSERFTPTTKSPFNWTTAPLSGGAPAWHTPRNSRCVSWTATECRVP